MGNAVLVQPGPRSKSGALIALLAVILAIGWWFLIHQNAPAAQELTIYYTKLDGSTEVPRAASLGPAHDLRSVTFYAATQALAGPDPDVQAIRFPSGTYVRSVVVNGSTAVVDLSKEVDGLAGGSFAEISAFKSLVWTMTAIPGIDAVTILVDGARVATIPGGHFELDEPLKRSTW